MAPGRKNNSEVVGERTRSSLPALSPFPSPGALEEAGQMRTSAHAGGVSPPNFEPLLPETSELLRALVVKIIPTRWGQGFRLVSKNPHKPHIAAFACAWAHKVCDLRTFSKHTAVRYTAPGVRGFKGALHLRLAVVIMRFYRAGPCGVCAVLARADGSAVRAQHHNHCTMHCIVKRVLELVVS